MNEFIETYKRLSKDEDGSGIAYQELEEFLSWISLDVRFTDVDIDGLLEKLR